uniref:Protein sleepless n=1 Tax=Cacopsylla melanoneura TaxID=428564 RepID=A0A8D8YPC7_9HEMI
MDLSNLFVYCFGLIFIYLTKSGSAKLLCMSCSSTHRPGSPSYCQNSLDLSNVTYVECTYSDVRAFINSVNAAQSQLNNRFGNTLGYEPHNPPPQYACAKTVLDGNKAGEPPVVIRGCVEHKKEGQDACRRLREDSSTSGKFTLHHCEECDTDKCNGGSFATPSTLGAMLLSTLAVFCLSRV